MFFLTLTSQGFFFFSLSEKLYVSTLHSYSQLFGFFFEPSFQRISKDH